MTTTGRQAVEMRDRRRTGGTINKAGVASGQCAAEHECREA